jgi:predicted DNA-binding transcriptional regulator AlpA
MTKAPESYGVLPATGFMRQSQLIPAIFPFSPATLWRKVKEGTFPKPIKLAPRITAWRVEDIRDLLNRGVWAGSNHPGPTRLGAPSLRTSEEDASRGTTKRGDRNIPSLALDSGAEHDGRRPQTGSANFANSPLSSRKVRAR